MIRRDLAFWTMIVSGPIAVIAIVGLLFMQSEHQNRLALHNHQLILENQAAIERSQELASENQRIIRQSLGVLLEHVRTEEARWHGQQR